MTRRLKYLGAATLLCVAAVATSRATGSLDRKQKCIDVFDSATNCFITLHDEKYGDGCRLMHDDEVPPCIDVGWKLCNALAAPPPWRPDGP
jgi:hypothetical protein